MAPCHRKDHNTERPFLTYMANNFFQQFSVAGLSFNRSKQEKLGDIGEGLEKDTSNFQITWSCTELDKVPWEQGFTLHTHKISSITCVLFLQPLHSKVLLRKFAIAINPHKLHTWQLYGSDTSNSRSFRNCAAPCAIIQSRSISPKRRPPSLKSKQYETNNYYNWRMEYSVFRWGKRGIERTKSFLRNWELLKR